MLPLLSEAGMYASITVVRKVKCLYSPPKRHYSAIICFMSKMQGMVSCLTALLCLSVG